MDGFEQVAPDVRRLSLLPFDMLNVYVVGDVLVDSGARFTRARLLAALKGETIEAHVLTHAHPDHQGASHAVCVARSIPLWCGDGDEVAAETGDFASVLPSSSGLLGRFGRLLGGPGHPVARKLPDGDLVSSFEVVRTPGHTPGHLALWRPSDRVLVLGDSLFHRHPLSLRRGLCEPFRSATHDVAANRRSLRRLAGLEPELICFGHGVPLRNGAVFRDYVSSVLR